MGSKHWEIVALGASQGWSRGAWVSGPGRGRTGGAQTEAPPPAQTRFPVPSKLCACVDSKGPRWPNGGASQWADLSWGRVTWRNRPEAGPGGFSAPRNPTGPRGQPCGAGPARGVCALHAGGSSGLPWAAGGREGPRRPYRLVWLDMASPESEWVSEWLYLFSAFKILFFNYSRHSLLFYIRFRWTG